MAYVVWRVLMKKYSKVRLGLHRNPQIVVTPSNKVAKTFDDESWKPTDDAQIATTSSILSASTTIATSTIDRGLDEVVVSADPETSCNNNTMSRGEIRRSKSKVRAYLKRCKDVLIGSQEDNCPITHHEPVSQCPNTSWYLDDADVAEKNEKNYSEANGNQSNIILIDDVKKPIGNISTDTNEIDFDQNRIEKSDEASESVIEICSSGDSQGSEGCCTVANLVDRYLGHLYSDYIDHTRSVLVRQARDLLVCTFHGDLSRFENDYLAPAAKLIENVKQSSNSGMILSWRRGWPLTVSGAVVLHLGALDESLLRPQDIYICIKPDILLPPKLCAVWRSHKNSNIIYHPLDPDKDSLSPLAIEMLAEELPQLLQSLLVGVEHAICRVPLDDLAFPLNDNTTTENDNDTISTNQTNRIPQISIMDEQKNSLNTIGSPKRSLECGIKRRELVTKNKLINNKYTLKRIIHKSENDKNNKTDTGSGGDNIEPISMPLFCLGGSFPHIDSDEESGDDPKKVDSAPCFPHELIAPKSIQDIPEKLLMSGIYLPGTYDISGKTIILIEVDKLIESGVNCYEIATVLLYYSTIPLSPTTFSIHLIVNESTQLNVLDLLDNSLQLLHGHVTFNIVLIFSTCEISDKQQKTHLPNCNIKICFVQTVSALSQYVTLENIPTTCGGYHLHNQKQWKELFTNLELLQTQCTSTGRRLVSVMGEIRNSDLQGQPSRRQLHSQHRALSRALMDPELQNLRRRGSTMITNLKEQYKCVNNKLQTMRDNVHDVHDYMSLRLNEAITLFNEVDRAAKRLEQLTEQRRERLRELTRQRALEDEINEETSWIKNDGELYLNKYMEVPLESGEVIKENEHEFEKFYFISMKHLAKGKDLNEAALTLESLKDLARNLKQSLHSFSERLELIRERIEGAARLHHLLGLPLKEDDIQQEMLKLAEKIGVLSLIERCKQSTKKDEKDDIKELERCNTPLLEQVLITSTPEKPNEPPPDTQTFNCWNDTEHNDIEQSTYYTVKDQTNLPVHDQEQNFNKSIIKQTHCDGIEEDEEDHSKMADSGLGGCDKCEGNYKLVRACSCQSFEDTANVCDKSNNSDDLEEDCFESSSSKPPLDLHAPFQPNSHLYCHASSLHLPEFEESSGLDQKTQKTLLLIMREMIGTERDYVRSLHYVIDNYIHELLREDIPQSLRGQRNVIFGNIERIYEFHQQDFLEELERYENNPLKAGAAFLRHESKFYLYALYNKNKPKSDSLMSEYGTVFFKSKQIELADKMDLASYLLKPVQRMGKYALLLQQLMKACSNIKGSASQDLLESLDELQKAEEMVRFQLRHGNDLLAMDSLRDCDVNVKEQGRLLRQSEFLVWQGRGGKKSLRQVFLFEELVLFSKARRFPDRKNLDIYIYKNSIKTSDIGLTAHIGDSPTKFEIWFRKRKPDDTWTLQSMSEDIKNAWADEVSKLLWKQARRNREMRLAEMSSMGIGNKPCLDIRPSLDQINDRSISISQLGKTPKFRNSFAGTLPEVKAARRPNSIISVSSGSSGASTGSSSGSGFGNHHPQAMGLELIHESVSHSGTTRKHHRSTTLVSQCSMESGIIADISMSPDDAHDNQNWPTTSRKSNNNHNISNEEKKIDSEPNTSINDPYINDSITVHL